jgi:hypothetical protein
MHRALGRRYSTSDSRMSQRSMNTKLKSIESDRQSRNERHTFVLVHGSWVGGWLWSIPPLPLSYLGITDPALVGFMTPKLVDHPWRTLFEPAKVLPRPAHVSMSYVRCTAFPIGDQFDRIMQRLTRDPNVRTATIDTTHLCMVTAPEATVKTVLDLAENPSPAAS